MKFNFFGKGGQEKPVEVKQQTPAEESGGDVLDFDKTIDQLKSLSPKAQATFLYKLVGALSPALAKTLQTYVQNRVKDGKDKNIGQKQYNAGRKTPSRGAPVW